MILEKLSSSTGINDFLSDLMTKNATKLASLCGLVNQGDLKIYKLKYVGN